MSKQKSRVLEAVHQDSADSRKRMIARLELIVARLREGESMHQLLVLYEQQSPDGLDVLCYSMMCPHPRCRADFIEACGRGLDDILTSSVLATVPTDQPAN